MSAAQIDSPLMRLVLATTCAIVAACDVEGVPPDGETLAAEYPDWVTRGSVVDARENALYAVGAKAAIRNQALLRAAADNQARAELVKLFQLFSATVMKDYAKSIAAGSDPTSITAATDEPSVGAAVKAFSAAALSSVTIVTHWIDPREGTLYARARLDLDDFSKKIDESKALSDEVKERFRRSIERAVTEIASEQ